MPPEPSHTPQARPTQATEGRGLWNDAHYRLLVESVRDYAIITLDPAGYVVTWNTGAERIKGYRADEIGVNRTKVRKVSQDFSIICHINMLGAWQIMGFVAFPSTFGGHLFFATHCQT